MDYLNHEHNELCSQNREACELAERSGQLIYALFAWIEVQRDYENFCRLMSLDETVRFL